MYPRRRRHPTRVLQAHRGVHITDRAPQERLRPGLPRHQAVSGQFSNGIQITFLGDNQS